MEIAELIILSIGLAMDAFAVSICKGISMKKMDAMMIKLPSLEDQGKIVSILDRFDILCNDLSSGLPAEIEARQKQYEYYRDKVLSF